MKNKNDWKEIERYIYNKEINKISDYKIDINNEYNKMLNRRKAKIKSKMILIIIILNMLINIFKTYIYQKRIDIIEQSVNTSVQEIPIKVSLFGNGLYSYKITNYPIEEIHAIFVSYKNIFKHDINDRLHKFYFEDWKDEDKNKFVIDQHYEEGKHNFIKEKEWILVYETYIETNTYEELMEATNILIKYNNYIGDLMFVGSNMYIKYKGNIINPIQTCEMSDDFIKNNVNEQYKNIDT